MKPLWQLHWFKQLLLEFHLQSTIQGHGTSTSKCIEIPCYTCYTRYICQSSSFLATQMVFFLCNMYPTCNLAVPEVCNLGGCLLSGIHDGLLCNLGHLSKCVDSHDHGRSVVWDLLTTSRFSAKFCVALSEKLGVRDTEPCQSNSTYLGKSFKILSWVMGMCSAGPTCMSRD